MSSRNTSVSSLGSEASELSSSSTLSDFGIADGPLISGLDHVNLLVPLHTLHHAHAFYANALGLHALTVPADCPYKGLVQWFEIAGSGQQIHIMSAHHLSPSQVQAQTESQRHFCFKIPSRAKLEKIQDIIWQLHQRGDEGDPIYCDEPVGRLSDARWGKGKMPVRFFARDYAGNRLEFSL